MSSYRYLKIRKGSNYKAARLRKLSIGSSGINEESKLNIGCIRFLKMNKDSMSCAHSNRSRVVERLASRAPEIWRARCSSFRGVRNSTERKEFDRNFFRGLAAPIVGIFKSTWVGTCQCAFLFFQSCRKMSRAKVPARQTRALISDEVLI